MIGKLVTCTYHDKGIGRILGVRDVEVPQHYSPSIRTVKLYLVEWQKDGNMEMWLSDLQEISFERGKVRLVA